MEEVLSDSQKINFLYQSIADTQGTIRAIDVKTGFLFVIIFLPLSELKNIIEICKVLFEASSLYYLGLSSFLLWFLSVITLFRCTVSISNPKDHIEGNVPDGTFFTSSLYTLSFIDNFINFPIKSNVSVEEYTNKLPQNEKCIIEELSFEKMKLAYIRDVKIKRSSFCTLMCFFWLISGCVTWMLFLLKVGF
jgi:hypothetical protein